MRYKERDWQKTYAASRKRLHTFLSTNGGDAVIAFEAQLMLKAHYRGPWRMLAALLGRELRSSFNHYLWLTWNRIRVDVFRGAQDEALAAFEREGQEHAALKNLSRTMAEGLCWECNEVKAEGKCPDCDDPGEWCAGCLCEHQRLAHSAIEGT